jgi:hypothetical protein
LGWLLSLELSVKGKIASPLTRRQLRRLKIKYSSMIINVINMNPLKQNVINP